MGRIHIGELIEKVFRNDYPRHTIDWFAQQLHCNRTNIYDIFHRQSIDTDRLLQISVILSHNFFADLAQELADYPPLISSDDVKENTLYDNIMSGISKVIRDNITDLPASNRES